MSRFRSTSEVVWRKYFCLIWMIAWQIQYLVTVKLAIKLLFFCWKVFYFLALPGCYETSTLEVLIGSPQSSLGRFALALYSTTLRPQHKLGLLYWPSPKGPLLFVLCKNTCRIQVILGTNWWQKDFSWGSLQLRLYYVFVDILGFNLPREIVGGDMTVAKIIISSNDVNPLTFYDSIL